VILERENEEEWLDPKAEINKLTRLLKPSPAPLDTYEIAKMVNSPSNDSPKCIDPVKIQSS
jgi:putative SOS response-associated peptidase YedK